MNENRRDWLFSIVIALTCLFLASIGPFRISEANQNGLHTRGLVTEVDNSNVRTNLIVKTEHQILTVRFLNGPHKGREVPVDNLLSGKLEFDEFYEPGDVVLIEYDAPGGEPAHARARGHYRLHGYPPYRPGLPLWP